MPTQQRVEAITKAIIEATGETVDYREERWPTHRHVLAVRCLSGSEVHAVEALGRADGWAVSGAGNDVTLTLHTT